MLKIQALWNVTLCHALWNVTLCHWESSLYYNGGLLFIGPYEHGELLGQ
jgi:hypothetical protein